METPPVIIHYSFIIHVFLGKSCIYVLNSISSPDTVLVTEADTKARIQPLSLRLIVRGMKQIGNRPEQYLREM